MTVKYYPRLLAVAAVMIFFTNLALYLFSSATISFPPLYWIIGLGVAAAPICFSSRSLTIICKAPLALWCYGFLMITGLWLMFQPTPSEIVLQELNNRILSTMFILTLLCLFAREDVQLWARRATLVAVLLAVALNIYEVFNPLAFSEVMGRSAGLYINPNQSAVALILGMIISIGLLPHRLRLLFVALVGIGVFLTLSRSAIVGWLITFFILIKTGQLSLRRSLVVASAILSVAFIVTAWQWERIEHKLEDLGVLNENTVSRLDWFNSLDTSDFSSVERKEVAGLGWEMFSESPIIGHGVGASVDWSFEVSSHNEYLNMMVDHGVFGLFLLPLFVLAAIWRASGEVKRISITFAAFILYFGFFSHNILFERYILMCFSLMSAMAITSQAKTQPATTDQKSSLACDDFPASESPIYRSSLCEYN